MKRLLWIDTTFDWFTKTLDNSKRKKEFFLQLPDGPLLPENTTIGFNVDGMTVDFFVDGQVLYRPKSDTYFISVSIELVELDGYGGEGKREILRVSREILGSRMARRE